MNKILMPTLDGGIVDYKDDTAYYPGCETCDYGSEYINDIVVVLTKYKIHAVINQMYSHALSEGDMMRTLLPAYEEIHAMTEQQFTIWFKDCLIEAMKTNDRFVDIETVLRDYDVQKMDGGAADANSR